ncbi:MAG: CRISPR-associated endonuclease Cas1 [Methanobacteriota archaeon]|nr:MAG: CRISPR-associated endonuclease Cas1 [Euryarchaeota archaeon]
MATLYLIEQNSILRKRGNRLLVCKRPPASRRYSAVLQKDIIRDLPAADVDHVMLFGNIQVTTSALHLLLEKGIELAIFKYGGELLGQLTPPMGKNIPLRIRQFECYRDPEFILGFSRDIVSAKIKNALEFLRQFHWNHPEAFEMKELNILEEMVEKAKQVTDLDNLLGIEGAAAAHYFKLYGTVIRPPWQFTGRSKRPPRDPVNAVLSFGYVIVCSQLQMLLDGMGLDPYLGFYHQVDYGRPGLALDLLEEFRHPLIDRLTATLFNKGVFEQSDFYHPISTAKHGERAVYLNTSGKRKFFLHYENALNEITPDVKTGDGFFPIFQCQVNNLIHAIQNNSPYAPYVIANS